MIDFPITINGVTLSSQKILQWSDNNHIRAKQYILRETNCSDDEAKEAVDDLFHMLQLSNHPPEMRQKEDHIKLQDHSKHVEKNRQPPITCPRCGSTQIATGARGWKWTTGFIGSGKTVNRCANCGKTWEPYYKRT